MLQAPFAAQTMHHLHAIPGGDTLFLGMKELQLELSFMGGWRLLEIADAVLEERRCPCLGAAICIYLLLFFFKPGIWEEEQHSFSRSREIGALMSFMFRAFGYISYCISVYYSRSLKYF